MENTTRNGEPTVQKVHAVNPADLLTGDPAGGKVRGVGLFIAWQNGPLGRGPGRRSPNGAFVETVITACIQRLESFQASRFKCQENADAIEHLKAAIGSLNARTARREAEGLEGTHQVAPAAPAASEGR